MPEVDADDPAMIKIREWLKSQEPALSLQELGERMGFPVATARKSAWQFLKCKVPRLDTLRRFAKASGVPIEDWVAETDQSNRKKKRSTAK